MSLMWIIYWIGIVDSVSIAFALIAVFGIIILLFYYAFRSNDWHDICYAAKRDEKPQPKFFNLPKYIYVIVAMLLMTAIFLPLSKTLTAMVLVPKIVQNKSIQHISKDSLRLLDVKLQQWTKDTLKRDT